MSQHGEESDPREVVGYKDRDPQFKDLSRFLQPYAIPKDSLLRFHDWLLQTQVNWRIGRAAQSLIGKETHKEQIDALVDIKRFAITLSTRFDLFEQLRPLDQCLCAAFQSARHLSDEYSSQAGRFWASDSAWFSGPA